MMQLLWSVSFFKRETTKSNANKKKQRRKYARSARQLRPEIPRSVIKIDRSVVPRAAFDSILCCCCCCFSFAFFRFSLSLSSPFFGGFFLLRTPTSFYFGSAFLLPPSDLPSTPCAPLRARSTRRRRINQAFHRRSSRPSWPLWHIAAFFSLVLFFFVCSKARSRPVIR